MKTIHYKDVAVILAEMLQYLSQLPEEEQESYARELYLSGLFHDAIGKVVVINETEDNVGIITEY